MVAFGLTAAWACASTGFILFRDEIAAGLLAERVELRRAYEERLAEMGDRLERERTRALVERTGFAARAEALSARQGEIEARQAWLSGLAQRLLREPTGRASRTATQSTSQEGPRPSGDAPAGLRLRPPAELGGDGAGERLSAVERSLGQVSSGLFDAAEIVRRSAGQRAGQARLALESTRLDRARLKPPLAAAGGPLVPLPPAFDTGSFSPVATDAAARVGELEHLLSTAQSLPLRRPLRGELEPTSGFGYRLDPFTRGPALHTGADFRAEAGSPVLATAAGRVVAAEYSGGYGQMIEIEHAAGVSTRYGHLSAYAVSPGTLVEAGQVIGRAGSTGRSTGAHLHYEVRVDGEPVNPSRFLDAGVLLPSGEAR